MKKFLMLFLLLGAFTLQAAAQKFALVDMEYIMGNIPAYERANEQLNQVSKKWQAEVEAKDTEAKTLYKKYQSESVFLSAEQKKEREQAIVAKEKVASEYKKRESLIRPIQDDIYSAIKSIADQRGFQLILDRASETAGIIFASPSIDISNEVLAKLGYSN